MTKKCYAVLTVIALAGCTPPTPPTPDRGLQRQIFVQCLEKAPAGPISTKYNDWSEVIDSCSNVSYYMAMPQ